MWRFFFFASLSLLMRWIRRFFLSFSNVNSFVRSWRTLQRSMHCISTFFSKLDDIIEENDESPHVQLFEIWCHLFFSFDDLIYLLFSQWRMTMMMMMMKWIWNQLFRWSIDEDVQLQHMSIFFILVHLIEFDGIDSPQLKDDIIRLRNQVKHLHMHLLVVQWTRRSSWRNQLMKVT